MNLGNSLFHARKKDKLDNCLGKEISCSAPVSG